MKIEYHSLILSKIDKSYENHFWRIHTTFKNLNGIDFDSTCSQT